MWLLERLVPDSTANNLSLVFQVAGKLDVAVLREAVATLLRRYEVLRTVYFATGAELMKGVVGAANFAVALEEHDDFVADSGDLETALRPFLNRRFAFDGRPLVRVGLFHHADGDLVCFGFHHLVYDIISGTTLLTELVAIYDDLVVGLVPADELLAVVRPFTEPAPAPESLDYWRERLETFDPGGLDLAYGAADGAEVTLRGGQVTHRLSAEARAAVQRLQREVRAPESVVLLAAFDLLLAAHGCGPDLTVGSPVSVRAKNDPGAVGHHTNVLPLRVHVDPALGFRELVRRVRDGYFGALAHAGVPVDSISELVPRAGSSWRNRLCRHLFNYFPELDFTEFLIGGQSARPLVVENGFSKFDLEFFVASSAGALTINARYGTEKFTEAEVEALVRRYETLLVTLDAEPDRPTGELRVWSETDRKVIETANATARRFDPADVLTAVHGHAVRTPDAVAVETGDTTVGYGRLWAAALAVRETLRSAGVGPGDIVAIAAARSPELVASVLGVWLGGAAYLPVDPEHPAERVAYLLADSGAKVILTDRDRLLLSDDRALPLAGLPAGGVAAGPAPVVDPEEPAYLIYTSGSTGRPKGTLIPHRAISNIAADYTERMRLTPADATLWMTTFAFDMANLEHYVPLYSGGRIVIAPDEARVDGRVLRDLLDRHRPGVVQATPTTWRIVLDEVEDRLAGVRVVIGAEPVPVTLARRLLATGCEVHHAYGPTETTTWCTWGILPARLGDRLDIGVPIWNTKVLVVAADGRELPVGVTGEVWIGGAGVALGYHGRPELTAERFGDHPYLGRFYRSGDLGRWRADGTLELFGRADRQVKLRGNRIELGEIEAVLLAHPKVRGSAAIVVGDRSSDGRLIAFLETSATVDELWDYSREQLPNSAIPQDFVVVDALPVNANEKVDYLALELLVSAGEAGPAAALGAGGAGDPLVRELTALWARHLGRDDITGESNFFTHGGHSLLGAKLLQDVEQELGVRVKLADLFEAPSPAGLAAHLSVLAGTASEDPENPANPEN